MIVKKKLGERGSVWYSSNLTVALKISNIVFKNKVGRQWKYECELVVLTGNIKARNGLVLVCFSVRNKQMLLD